MQRSCYDRIYHTFKEGDEVFTDRKHFKAITAFKNYRVIRCYKPTGFIENYPVMVVELMSERGFISTYATDRFYKSPAQVRDDKISNILEHL